MVPSFLLHLSGLNNRPVTDGPRFISDGGVRKIQKIMKLLKIREHRVRRFFDSCNSCSRSNESCDTFVCNQTIIESLRYCYVKKLVVESFEYFLLLPTVLQSLCLSGQKVLTGGKFHVRAFDIFTCISSILLLIFVNFFLIKYI